MKKLTLSSLCAVTVAGVAMPRAVDRRPLVAFEELKMRIEVDLPSAMSGHDPRWTGSPLDLRAEVVFEARSSARIATIRVLDASRRPLLSFDGASPKGIGLSEIALEFEGSLRDVRREYPAGEYVVEATTVDGDFIEGRTQLSHGFPGRFVVTSPLQDEPVESDDVTIGWTPSQRAASYTFEVEHDASGFSMEITLPPWQTHFALPGAMLRPGETYEYSLAVRGDTDNELEHEGRFTTASAHHIPASAHRR